MNKKSSVLAVGAAIALMAVDVIAEEDLAPSLEIVRSVGEPRLAAVLADVLERNPEIAAAQAAAGAAAQVAPQRRALPDPQAQLTAFVLPPETRVGPQRAVASVSQRLPGGSKRRLGRQAAEQHAEASRADLEALRIQLLTEARKQYLEIGYLDAAVTVLETDRAVLSHFEELARARYISGSGLQQEVVSIQADITRIEARLADIRGSRASRVAVLNQLRERPGVSVGPIDLPTRRLPVLDWPVLRSRAMAARPELQAAASRIQGAAAEIELATRRGGPDFSIGLTYAWVDRRRDVDVPDNGQDVFGVTGGITLPVWRNALDAGVEEATQRNISAEAHRRRVVSAIDRQLEQLRGRLPEIQRQVEIFEGVLRIQAEQALESAEAAYASGRIDAVALLESERTLLDVRLAAARSRTDLEIALVELEGAIAQPLERMTGDLSVGDSEGEIAESPAGKTEYAGTASGMSADPVTRDAFVRPQLAIRGQRLSTHQESADGAAADDVVGGGAS